MVSLGKSGGEDDEETQELEEPDTPPSVSVGDCECTTPQEETLPLEEDTELMRDDTTGLWGDIQVPEEDPECAIGTWVATHVVEDDDDDGDEIEEGSGRTEVLSDDGGGISDDGATAARCADKNSGSDGGIGGENMRSALRQSSTTTPVLDEHCSEKDLAVASEALTCGDRSSGSSKRSFSAVRTASLQASCRAAKRSMTPKCAEINSFVSETQFNEKQKFGIGAKPRTDELEKVVGMVSSTKLTSLPDSNTGGHILSSLIGDTGVETKTKRDFGSDRNYRVGGGCVRKLSFYENIEKEDVRSQKINARDDELANETNGCMGKEDSVQMLVQGYSAAGLSYIASQEPGELSQANALDVVDKLLSINDVGLSQDACVGKTGETTIPSLSDMKGGAQRLAKSAHRSPVGKETIYEWFDSLEDEGGGDFFVKRKSSLFVGDKHLKKSRSQPPKSKRPNKRTAKTSIDYDKVTEGTDPGAQFKSKGLSFSDSMIKARAVIGSRKLEHFENTTVKKVIKDMNAEMDHENANQQLEEDNVVMDVPGTSDVGPNTQMAAEAMEVLLCDLPAEKDSRWGASTGTEHSREVERLSRDSLEPGTLKKKLLTDFDGTIRRSKRIKMSGADTGSKSQQSSRKGLKRSKERNKLGEGTLGKLTNEKSISEEKSRLLESVKAYDVSNVKSFPIKGNKARKIFAKSFISVKGCKVDRCNSGMHDQLKLHGEKLLIDMNATPIACRTRQAMTAKTSKKMNVIKQLPSDAENLQIDMTCTPVARRTRQSMTKGTSEKVDVLSKSDADPENDLKLASVRKRSACRQSSNVECCDPSGTTYDKQRGKPIRYQPDIQDSKVSQLMTGIVSSLPHVTPFHPKRRTCLDVSWYSMDEVVPGCKLSSVEQNQSQTVDESISDVQKRKAVDGLPLVADEMYGIRDMSTTTGVRTRSSTSHGCKPFQFKSDEISKGKKLFEGGISCSNTSVANTRENTLPKEPLPHARCTTSASHGEDIEPGTSLKEKGHPADATCTFDKVIEGSPICTGLNPLQMSKKTLSKPSLVKELIRLESTNRTQTPVLQDSRRRRDMSNVRVLFSRHLDEDILKHQKRILARFGIPVASSSADATHFITDRFVRTRNLLEAMAVGKPVVTSMWLKSCGQAHCFIDEKNYILRDLKKEKDIGFSMSASLAHARQTPLLQGKRVFITPNVKPDRETVSSLIKAAGGQPVERIGRTIINEDKVPDELLVISCEEDYAICTPLLEKGTRVFDSELLLNGIVIQKLEYDRHRLFLDHVRQTRSTIWLRTESSNQFLPVSKCK